MQTTVRQYNQAADYERVGRFLVRTYSSTGGHVNWLQARWEYMHYHPLIRNVDVSSIGEQRLQSLRNQQADGVIT